MDAKRIDQNTKANMYCSQNTHRCGHESVSPLIVCDLRAQLAPLNSYGLPGLGVAVAESLRALVGASRTALAAVLPAQRSELTS
jgi:hypothetical protein